MAGAAKLLKSVVKFTAFKIVYPAVYKISALRKCDKGKVIFAEIRSDKLTDNFRYIYQRLENTQGIKPQLFAVNNISGGMGYLWKYAKLCAEMGNAGAVLINESCNLFGAFRFRKETKVIQTWHACGAFKKWGLSSAEGTFGESRREQEKYPAHTSYTLCPVSSEECIWAYREAFGLKDNADCVKAMGVSRTDFYFKEQNILNAQKRLDEVLEKRLTGGRKGRKVILYAPTFRGQPSRAYIPEKLHIRALREKFGGDLVLLIKRHGFVKKQWDIPSDCMDFAADVTEDMGIEQLIVTADMLITDYSSVIFEYSLMRRPMIFYAFDLADYYDARGFYYSYDESFLPGGIAEDGGRLFELISEAAKTDYSERADRFRKRFMGACDGKATDRIADYILNKQ